jgi:hypothetical protein
MPGELGDAMRHAGPVVRDDVRRGAAVAVGVGPRVRVAAGILVAVAVLSACSKIIGGGSGGSAGSGTPTPAATSSAAAVTALQTSASQVRSQVQQLQTPLLAGAAQQLTLVDDAGPCEIGVDNPWPQRWGYGVMVQLKSTDPVQPAGELRAHLKSQGWTIRSHETTPDSLDFDARRSGVVLRISGEPNPATVKIEGYGECIGVDGKPSA